MYGLFLKLLLRGDWHKIYCCYYYLYNTMFVFELFQAIPLLFWFWPGWWCLPPWWWSPLRLPGLLIRCLKMTDSGEQSLFHSGERSLFLKGLRSFITLDLWRNALLELGDVLSTKTFYESTFAPGVLWLPAIPFNVFCWDMRLCALLPSRLALFVSC